MDDAELRKRAYQSYGTSCSLIHCKAGGGLEGNERLIILDKDLKAWRDPEGDGTWITAHIFIADS